MERPTDITEKVWGIWQKVVSRANRLKVLGCLDTTETKQGKEASNILLHVQTSRRRQIYKLFLHDALSGSGSIAVLLCAIAAGPTQIAGLKATDRTQLSNLICSRPNDINYPVIRSLADKCKIPSSKDDTSLPAASNSQSDEQSREHTSPLETANLSPGIEERRQIVNNNATLRGVNKVFNKYIANAIRRVTDQNEVKAAVTMVLPLWGGVDCYVSLYICEDEVGKLAMALFGAKVSQAQQFLRLEREGIVVNIPSSEATIGGVLDEDILEVFGSVIHAAIDENHLRERELKEGKLATECVSMGFTKNGAIINLSLGLERGLKIMAELYT